MKTPSTLLLVFCSALLSFPALAKEKRPVVYVPVLPYEWLFERIGGEWIEVHTIVGEGDDCHDYSPSPKQITRLADANLIFSGDLGFEGNFFVKTGDGISAPKEISLLEGLDLLEGSCAICEHDHAEHGHAEDGHAEHGKEEKAQAKQGEKSAAGVAVTKDEKHEGEEHEHEEHADHDHDHGALKDPHVWLSPRLLSQQAVRVAAILKEHAAPEAAAPIDANLKALLSDLKSIDAELTETLAPIKGETFYVYHAAFAYFADAYGLRQKAIETTGRRPSPRQIGEIAKQAKDDGVKLIFVQPQFDQSSAASLAATIGGDVAELDPLEKDVLGNLRKIANLIRNRQG